MTGEGLEADHAATPPSSVGQASGKGRRSREEVQPTASIFSPQPRGRAPDRKRQTERTGSLKVHHEAQEVFASLLPPRCDIVVRATGPAVPADLGFVGLEARDGRGGPSGTDHAERALVNREQEETLAWTYFETCGETKGTRAKPTGVRSAQGPEGPRPATHQLRLQQKWFYVYYRVV